MGGGQAQATGPDLAAGIPLGDLADGATLLGHVEGEGVLLVRRGDEILAIGAKCTHYGGPLGEGLVVGDTVRCPWHHACFSLRTGEAIGAPALNPVDCWAVDKSGDRLRVTGKREAKPAPALRAAGIPERIVIVGAGAAGNAAAEKLRRAGYDGTLTLFGAEASVPTDRPNLSKDYLAGNAPEEWMPLRSEDFYAEQRIELEVGRRVESLDVEGRQVRLDDGRDVPFDALLLATGADPVRPPIPGLERPFVHTLRTLADSRAIIAGAEAAKKAVVVGASFIGLEVAASLRARKLDVAVVAPEARPLERILGAEVGDFVKGLHEANGVVFHLGHTVARIEADGVVLDDGQRLAADLVVVGVGVRPAVSLAERAGLSVDNGIVVDRYLQTRVPGVYAAGDAARWPDPRTGKPVRIEHWVVAERMGQAAALNMLGQRRPFEDVPFFWSQHYDVTLAYVGHAAEWDRIDRAGSLADHDCALAYRAGGRTLAVATIGRDQDSLRAELALANGDEEGLAAIVPAG